MAKCDSAAFTSWGEYMNIMELRTEWEKSSVHNLNIYAYTYRTHICAKGICFSYCFIPIRTYYLELHTTCLRVGTNLTITEFGITGKGLVFSITFFSFPLPNSYYNSCYSCLCFIYRYHLVLCFNQSMWVELFSLSDPVRGHMTVMIVIITWPVKYDHNVLYEIVHVWKL